MRAGGDGSQAAASRSRRTVQSVLKLLVLSHLQVQQQPQKQTCACFRARSLSGFREKPRRCFRPHRRAFEGVCPSCTTVMHKRRSNKVLQRGRRCSPNLGWFGLLCVVCPTRPTDHSEEVREKDRRGFHITHYQGCVGIVPPQRASQPFAPSTHDSSRWGFEP